MNFVRKHQIQVKYFLKKIYLIFLTFNNRIYFGQLLKLISDFKPCLLIVSVAYLNFVHIFVIINGSGS